MSLRNEKWQVIQSNNPFIMERMKVHQGWLINLRHAESRQFSLTFVPDKSHAWLNENDYSSLPMVDKLFMEINKLKLSNRLYELLNNLGYKYIGDIVCDEQFVKKNSFNDIMANINFGTKSYNELIEILNTLGFVIPIKNDEYWKIRPTKL